MTGPEGRDIMCINCVCVYGVYNLPMDKAVDELMRQQYLVPRRSVAKLRQLSRQQKVSATEIVRRAIDAYDPVSEQMAVQEAAALDLLVEVHAQLRKAMRRIDSSMQALQLRQRALEDGKLSAQARRDAESWLRRHPQALEGLSELFGQAAEVEAAAGVDGEPRALADTRARGARR